jgi:hypothetical protein
VESIDFPHSVPSFRSAPTLDLSRHDPLQLHDLLDVFPCAGRNVICRAAEVDRSAGANSEQAGSQIGSSQKFTRIYPVFALDLISAGEERL